MSAPVPLRSPQPADPTAIRLSDFFWRRAARDPNTTPDDYPHFAQALSAFRRFLGDRAPTVAHLTGETLERLATWIIDRGRKPSTAARIVQELVNLGRAAAAEGLLSEPPEVRTIHRRGAIERRPLSIEEIERLLAQCLLEPGDVAGVPARDWWTALLLLILNLQISVRVAVAIPRSGLRVRKSCAELAPGDGFVYALHPLTWSAVEKLPSESPMLLPSAYERLDMYYWHLNRLFRLAGIPRQRGLSFDRIQAAALASPGLLDRLDVDRIARLAEQIRAAAIAREARKAEQKRRRAKKAHKAVAKALRSPKALRHVYVIASDSPRTLRRFFRDVYYPRRLKPFDASQGTVDRYETLFNRLAAFVGAEVTLEGAANRGFLEDVQAWMIETGRSPHTVNGVVAHLQALLRYAKRRDYLPQSVNVDFTDKLTALKRDPVCLSPEEFARTLAAAATLPGHFNGLPYRQLLPAVMLTCYWTALRISAIVQLRSENLLGNLLHVDACTQKHKSDQKFPLDDQAVAAIEALDPHSREMLFAGPARQPGQRAPRQDVIEAGRRWRKRLHRALAIAGVKVPKPGFHLLRRTSITMVAAHGSRELAVQHAGHSHESVTDRYIDPRFLARQSVLPVLPRVEFQPAADPPAPRLLEHSPAIAAADVESEVQP